MTCMAKAYPELLSSSQPHPENTEAVQRYFEDAGKQLWSQELLILSEQSFRVAGKEAEKEGWFLGRNAVVQGTLAAKVAELLHLSQEETILLTQAAFFTSVMVRLQKESLEKQGKTFADSTIEERLAFDKQGAEILRAKGVDPRVIEIAMDAHSPEFYERAARGKIQPKSPEEERMFRLKRYLLYVHNSVVRNTDTATTTYVIAPWQERLGLTKEDYAAYGAAHHSEEAQLTENIETELREKIIDQTSLQQSDVPLWKFLQSKILEDVRAGSLPKIPNGRV